MLGLEERAYRSKYLLDFDDFDDFADFIIKYFNYSNFHLE